MISIVSIHKGGQARIPDFDISPRILQNFMILLIQFNGLVRQLCFLALSFLKSYTFLTEWLRRYSSLEILIKKYFFFFKIKLLKNMSTRVFFQIQVILGDIVVC